MNYIMGYIATVLVALILFCMFLVVNTYGLSIVALLVVLYLSVYIAIIALMIKSK